MAKEEMLKRIDEIETQRFYLDMVDRWDTRTYDLDTRLANELYDLKRKVAKLS